MPSRPLYRHALAALGLVACFGLAGCLGGSDYSLANAQALTKLAQEPLPPNQSWSFGDAHGILITTPHFRIFTTIQDPLYRHLLVLTLEDTHDRVNAVNGNTNIPAPNTLLDCYVFGTRNQWESYARYSGGANAPVYLQIAAGGYCQQGIFSGYDIGREQTLSVIAHEAWHQYSWFAFKDRLPSWLEEGIATQNEGVQWETTADGQLHTIFHPELNWRRFKALQDADRGHRLWKLTDLLSTHAGKVIGMQQNSVDSYYAQLWSLTLFLQHSPVYTPRLQSMLADARAGKMVQALAGTGLQPAEIAAFTERWNTIAGPVYAKKYFNEDLGKLEADYLAFLKTFDQNWPPKLPSP